MRNFSAPVLVAMILMLFGMAFFFPQGVSGHLGCAADDTQCLAQEEQEHQQGTPHELADEDVDTDVSDECPADHFCIGDILKIPTLQALLERIITTLLEFGAPIAIIMFIYGGLSFIFAAGDPEKITRARAILLWTAVGYGIIVVASGLITVIKTFLEVT